MITRFHLFAGALAGVLACSVAGAQARNGTSSLTTPRPSAHAKPLARTLPDSKGNAFTPGPARQRTSVIQVAPSGAVSSEFVPLENSFDFDRIPRVPGLGFDFPHLAAISGALAKDTPHFGRHGHHGQGFIMPIFYGGYPFYSDDLGYDQADQQVAPQYQAQPQTQIIVIQQPVPAQPSAEAGTEAAIPPPAVSETPAAPPTPDIGNFILVRRDGRVLFASVFSVVGAQLQYVTPEGIRHTMEMFDLDAQATEQMNEARGTTVQLHN